jgi:pyruvate-formate lyase
MHPERASILYKMAGNLKHIAYNKPESFWQAAQLAYLFYLVSGTYNYGRMDDYLGSYYANNIDTGAVTEEFGFSLIKNLWYLIVERNNYFDSRVILGGKDRKNMEAADRFALAAMEASRQTRDAVPQLTLRCYNGMNEELYNKALELIGEGTTYPILYNDEVNIPSVSEALNISLEEASEYVPFGCGEYVIYNKSFGTPSGAINFLQGLNTCIYNGIYNYLEASPDFDSFYNAYLSKMEQLILLLAEQEKLEYDICAMDAPYLYFSIMFDDCLDRGKAIFEGRIRYLGGTLEGYGNTNTSDSLAAIKTLVYDTKAINARQLTNVLKNNFEGCENIRQLLLDVPKYGNDNDDADDMVHASIMIFAVLYVIAVRKLIFIPICR